jgi:serine/threonine-protein kinase
VSLGELETLDQIGGTALVGTTIADGKYEIIRVLGKGGMGVVYQARQPAMDRMVALKLIRPEAVTSADAVARFHREMLATARVEHPNTVRLYDFGEAAGQLYLAMEFLAGSTLRDVLERDGRLPAERIVRIGRQVGQALGAVHRHGLVHRDLKPDNVMLVEGYGESDFVKVLDFGIARSLERNAQLTATGQLVGTPAYMAPEQAMGDPIDHRADLYALGVMLFRMASGQPPFAAPTTARMLLAHATEIPAPLLALAPDTPPALAALIMQLLEKAPAARPASAAEVVARLDHCLLPPAPPTRAARNTGAAKPARRWLTLAVSGVVAAGAVTGYALHASDTAPPGSSAKPIDPAIGPAADLATGPGTDAMRKQLDALRDPGEPPAPDLCRSSDPAVLTRLIAARHALDDGRSDNAIAALGDPVAASTEAWTILARAQIARDASQARVSAAEAARLCPDYAVAHNALGNALQKLGDNAAAKPAYQRALAIAPSYDAPRFNLGLVQIRDQDPAAVATFSELLRRRPDYRNAHLARAQAYAMQGNQDRALADLEQAVAQQPGSADAWAALGELRERMKRGDAHAAYCRAKQLGDTRSATRCNDP